MIIKICGITRPADAALAAEVGADWIGLNFWSGSKRYVDVERAAQIVRVIPDHVLKVGVFVNASFDEIEATREAVGLDLIQLHGDEDAAFAARFGDRAIRAVRVSADTILDGNPHAFLLDTPSAHYGGSGRTFDWSLARAAVSAGHKIIVAGGLTAENVADAIRQVHPFGVDVAGGVEAAPGLKDPDKLRRFVAAARARE